jgi:hypothetical protein
MRTREQIFPENLQFARFGRKLHAQLLAASMKRSVRLSASLRQKNSTGSIGAILLISF